MHTQTPLIPGDTQPEEEDFSFSGLVQNGWKNVLAAFRQWRIIVPVAIVGGLAGIGASWIKHTTYSARLSFVVEEAKAAGGSIASALAGQFGFDLGNLSGTSGILAGDNVMELLKSHSLIRQTLLTPATDSSAISLADRYADVYELKEKWKNSRKIGRLVQFKAGQTNLPRLEDSLLQTMVKRLLEKELSIAKPDKKLGFFELQVTTREEKLSEQICVRLLKNATDFYIDAKTKRLKNNVARLQKRADSLQQMLDRKTFSTAEANRLLLDGNPVYSSPTADAEISSRNKFIQSTIFAEIIKNLEISKTSLIQETPTVQVVDYPQEPLPENKLEWYTGALAGTAAAFVLSMLFFIYWKRE